MNRDWAGRECCEELLGDLDCRRAELDYMEPVEHRDGVLLLVVDGVLVAVERAQSGDRDAFVECVAAVAKPRCVGLTGAARDQVQKPSPDVSATEILTALGGR